VDYLLDEFRDMPEAKNEANILVTTDTFYASAIPQKRMDLLVPDTAIIMIDEIHLLSLDVEFLLGVLPLILKRRPDLRLIITSANCHSERLLNHFRSFSPIKIEIHGRPQALTHAHPGSADMTSSYEILIVRCISLMFSDPRIMDGDVLIFLPDDDKIAEVAQMCIRALNKDHGIGLRNVEFIKILDEDPLSGLKTASTDRLDESGMVKRKIIFASNVIGSSITLPRIRLVVLSGKRTFSRYHCTLRGTEVVTESCSQAELAQMAGRAGRLRPGLAVYCFSREVYDQLAPHTPPPLHNGDITRTIMRALGTVGSLGNFKWFTTPHPEQIETSVQRLVATGMITMSR
jgi:ATP-dependent helicase HrpA